MFRLALVLALSSSASFADTLDEARKCRKIEDHAVRLDCYDTAMDKKETPVASGEFVSWKDLQLDYDKLKGKRISTSGTLMLLGEQALLYDETVGMTAFFIEIKKVPRSQRAAIIENCQGPCSVTINGKVSDVMMQRGIIATAVDLN